jgi:ferredoxin-thioredoxin reductase catalytic chain
MTDDTSKKQKESIAGRFKRLLAPESDCGCGGGGCCGNVKSDRKRNMADEPTTLTEDELVDEIRAWAEQYARDHDLVLNPDERVRNAVIRGLARNQLRHGERFCPCRIRKGVPEEDAKIACPCVYHKEEIAVEGHCHCNLFFRKSAVEQGG